MLLMGPAGTFQTTDAQSTQERHCFDNRVKFPNGNSSPEKYRKEVHVNNLLSMTGTQYNRGRL